LTSGVGSPRWPRTPAQSAALELELAQPLGHEPLGVGEVDELVQPVGAQQVARVCLELDLAPVRIEAAFLVDELGERGERVREHCLLGRSVDLELELARVLDPSLHALA
jgi:hypothetical protein